MNYCVLVWTIVFVDCVFIQGLFILKRGQTTMIIKYFRQKCIYVNQYICVKQYVYDVNQSVYLCGSVCVFQRQHSAQFSVFKNNSCCCSIIKGFAENCSWLFLCKLVRADIGGHSWSIIQHRLQSAWMLVYWLLLLSRLVIKHLLWLEVGVQVSKRGVEEAV